MEMSGSIIEFLTVAKHLHGIDGLFLKHDPIHPLTRAVLDLKQTRRVPLVVGHPLRPLGYVLPRFPVSSNAGFELTATAARIQAHDKKDRVLWKEDLAT